MHTWAALAGFNMSAYCGSTRRRRCTSPSGSTFRQSTTPDTVALSWQLHEGTQAGIQIDRTGPDGATIELPMLSPAATGLVDTGLTAETAYDYVILSVAVDDTLVPMGTAVYIPELDGMPTEPNGSGKHDGCFVAQDRGLHMRFRSFERDVPADRVHRVQPRGVQ